MVHSTYSFVDNSVTTGNCSPYTSTRYRYGALLYLSVLGVRGGPGVVALLGHAALTDHCLLSLYFTMVQVSASPALLHIPPPATVKYSGCLAAAAAAQLPVSFTPVLRLTDAACSLVTARPGLCCSSSGRGSRCRCVQLQGGS